MWCEGRVLPGPRVCSRVLNPRSGGAGRGERALFAALPPDLTIEKLSGVFDVLKPHLIDVYETIMRETDQIADAPTMA